MPTSLRSHVALCLSAALPLSLAAGCDSDAPPRTRAGSSEERPPVPVDSSAPERVQPSEIAWREVVEVRQPVDSQCFAGSDRQDPEAASGFSVSANESQRIDPALRVSPSLYLHADRSIRVPGGSGSGMRVWLVNGTREGVWLDAIDSSVAILQQALHPGGDWRDIERVRPAICGRSHHRVLLGPGRFWRFAAHRYDGPVKTRLRFRLVRGGHPDIVSNEFDGGVHLGQFAER